MLVASLPGKQGRILKCSQLMTFLTYGSTHTSLKHPLVGTTPCSRGVDGAHKKISLEFHLGGNYIYNRKKSWEPDGNQCSLKKSSTFCPGSLDT